MWINYNWQHIKLQSLKHPYNCVVMINNTDQNTIAPPVRFIALPEVDRSKSIEAGCPVVLQCELSDPSAQVFWYKDEAKLLPQSGLDFQSNGTKRALVVEKADFFHSGVYSCKTKGAAVQFNVEIKGD